MFTRNNDHNDAMTMIWWRGGRDDVDDDEDDHDKPPLTITEL